MKKLFEPDFVFARYSDITPEFLIRNNVKAVISDIDNTLAPYEQERPDENIISWIKELESAGIKLAFLSNNNAERVSLFNENLGVPAFPDSHKPSVKNLKKALEATGSTRETAVCLGDQLFTDVWTAHRYGMKCLLVPPINDKKTLFFRFKRWLEIPAIKKYRKKHAEDFPELPSNNPWF